MTCNTAKQIINNRKDFQKNYGNILIENKSILKELTYRNTNQEALMTALKEVNRMIVKAGNLRYGNTKNTVIALCRQALKEKNMFQLVQVI
jgi:hypothetical protein